MFCPPDWKVGFFHLMELKKGLCPPDIFLKVESVCLIICWRRSLSTWWHVKKYLANAHLMPCKNGLRLTDDMCNGVFFHLKTCYLKNGLCPLEEKERRLNPTKKIEEWSSTTSWNSKMVFVNLIACEKPFCPPDVLQKKVSLYMCWFCSLLLPLNERGWKPITI